MMTRGSGSGAYPDVSTCTSLQMNLMATEAYTGYRVSFGNVHLPEGHHAYGYKADFDAPVGNYDNVVIPFTDFSAKWNEGTGDQMVSCKDNEKYCPDAATLKNMETFAIWGEGVAGDVRLRVKSISAVGCSAGQVSSSAKAIMEKLPASASEISIESFDNPSLTWSSKNDPVMGGESTSTVEIEDGIGKFDGEVVDVPFLHSPGFIQMVGSGSYPDVSTCASLQMNLMAMEAYEGYRISFGNVHLTEMRHSRGYHADFDAPVGTYDNVVIPFNNFSAKWDPGTGDQMVSCKENPKYCPDGKTLKDMETFAIWGEGVAGNVRLRVKSISAVGCTGEVGEVSSSATNASMEKTNAGAASGEETTNGEDKASAERKKSYGSLLALGGFVGFAAFLSSVILNLVRSKKNSYAEVQGAPAVNDLV